MYNFLFLKLKTCIINHFIPYTYVPFVSKVIGVFIKTVCRQMGPKPIGFDQTCPSSEEDPNPTNRAGL